MQYFGCFFHCLHGLAGLMGRCAAIDFHAAEEVVMVDHAGVAAFVSSATRCPARSSGYRQSAHRTAADRRGCERYRWSARTIAQMSGSLNQIVYVFRPIDNFAARGDPGNGTFRLLAFSRSICTTNWGSRCVVNVVKRG